MFVSDDWRRRNCRLLCIGASRTVKLLLGTDGVRSMLFFFFFFFFFDLLLIASTLSAAGDGDFSQTYTGHSCGHLRL